MFISSKLTIEIYIAVCPYSNYFPVCYFCTLPLACQIRSLFEEHGKVLEVVLLKDKRTGLQQGMQMYIFYEFNCRFSNPPPYMQSLCLDTLFTTPYILLVMLTVIEFAEEMTIYHKLYVKLLLLQNVVL